MSEYEQTQAVGAPPEEVFAWLSDAGNLPKYLPPVTDASMEGPSAEGTPGRRVRTTLEYPGGGGSFDAEGYLAVDEGRRRMEWGAEAGRDYSGWLTVAESGAGASEVTVHLSLGERSVESEMEGQAPEGEDPLGRGIAETLESIRRQIEEGSGKVEPTPPLPGAEPPTEENPAVVRDAPPRPTTGGRRRGLSAGGPAQTGSGSSQVEHDPSRPASAGRQSEASGLRVRRCTTFWTCAEERGVGSVWKRP